MPKKYRAKISKLILDVAEKLPKLESGYIYSLQEMRRYQREESEIHNESMLSQNSNLDILSFRMIEIFHYEDFENLWGNLRKLFTNSKDFTLIENLNRTTEKFSDSLGMGGWSKLGYLYRDKKPFGTINSFKLSRLPMEVDYIEVKLHKILSSTIAITLDVYLDAKVNIKLNELQKSKYLAEVEIERIFPQSASFGFRSSTSDHIKEKIVTEYLIDIRKGIEKAISPYVFGYFMKQAKQTNKLPSIEIYTIDSKIKNLKKDIISWEKTTRSWLTPLGINLDFNTYNNKNIAFIWGNRTNYTEILTAHRVLVFCDLYLKNADLKVYGNDKKFAIAHKITYFLDSILIPLVSIEFLKQEIETVKKFRARVYSIMANRRTQVSSLKRQLILYNNLQQEMLIPERFMTEFEHVQKHIQRKISLSESEKLFYTNFSPKHKVKEDDFEVTVFVRIDNLIKTYNSNMNLLNKTFSKYVEHLNITAIYQLQIFSTLFSLLALIIAMLGILGNWNDIIQFCKDLLIFIRS